jgi:transcriptional regulator with XRE-family HTH domain
VKTPLLREWRESMGETQHTLSALSGITVATISRIENGFPLRPGTAKKLAEALGVSVVDLMNNPPVPAGKAEAPATELSVLLKKALNAARLDAAKNQKARNRLQASEGTLPATHVTGFETDKVGLELREGGFGDDQVEEFIWPLITQVVELEREISRRRPGEASSDVAAEAGAAVEEATTEAQTIVEKIEAEYREREEALGKIARATEEAAQEAPNIAGDLAGEWVWALTESPEVRRRLAKEHEAFAQRLKEVQDAGSPSEAERTTNNG